MRLLQLTDDDELILNEFSGHQVPPYAILSHTWGQDEESFADLVNNTARGKPGYRKIRFCALQAQRDGLAYFWVDTCCIDKSSSAELSEAINSMFMWYQNAQKCYVYLSDVSIEARNSLSFQTSRWFTRAWTLQELIAPSSVEFFSADGCRIGDKVSMLSEIHYITDIPISVLEGAALSNFSIDERMSWAKGRYATCEEDWAYSLLGLFGANIPLICGEGRRSSLALQSTATVGPR
jgi:hypothetical protein